MQLQKNLADIISCCVTHALFLVVVGVRLLTLLVAVVALTVGMWHLLIDSWCLSPVPTPRHSNGCPCWGTIPWVMHFKWRAQPPVHFLPPRLINFPLIDKRWAADAMRGGRFAELDKLYSWLGGVHRSAGMRCTYKDFVQWAYVLFRNMWCDYNYDLVCQSYFCHFFFVLCRKAEI